MKTKQSKSTLYSPPKADALVVTAEGVLCASIESYSDYEGNVGFTWEEE